MTQEQMILGAAAVVVAAWPSLKKAAAMLWAAVKPAPGAAPPPAPHVLPLPGSEPVSTVVSYESAIHDLAIVRSRLAATQLLDDPAKKAIDTLTLALVAGSDK